MRGVHKEKKEGQDRIVCEFGCGETFYRQCDADEHKVRKHTKERKFDCSECSKAFYTKNELKTHFKTKTHTKAADLKCREGKCDEHIVYRM